MEQKVTLNDDVRSLAGIGDKRAALLAGIGIRTVSDLLFHIPHRYINFSQSQTLTDLVADKHYSVTVKLEKIKVNRYYRGRGNLQAFFSLGEDKLECVWFNWGKWHFKLLQPGSYYVVSGEVKVVGKRKVITHPSVELVMGNVDEQKEDVDCLQEDYVPVYPTTEGLSQKLLRSTIQNALKNYQITESLPPRYLYEYSLLPLPEAIKKIHVPKSEEEANAARRRLAFEELLYHQLMLARVYYRKKRFSQGIVFENKGGLIAKFTKSLPFDLTLAQERAIQEIFTDMRAERQMNRLLQGDVGSGKTIVALLAMLLSVDNGYRAVVLVPTEILAQQHFKSISAMVKGFGIRVALLVGGKNKKKEEALKGIASGEYDIIVGTHALLQERVIFNNVGLVVIDEQQRFGVIQRAIIPHSVASTGSRRKKPDVIYLTATPIPRTLALSVYGDLDLSIIDELPKNRKPVKTIKVNAAARDKLFERVAGLIEKGQQVYIVCPLIKESDKLPLQDVETTYENVKSSVLNKYRTALLHGEMKSAEKEEIMTRFGSGEIDILVSTTVIEVGVDVPNASVMVIENAERFGLSQLHQLRGRVGRGSTESFCFLIAYPPLSAVAKERLKAIVDSNDGFVIAEKDLQLRGPGELFGEEQSGMEDFRIADILKDRETLLQARELAFKLIEENYYLSGWDRSLIRSKYHLHYSEKEKLFSH